MDNARKRLFALRERLFSDITKYFETESHCKNYEGAFYIIEGLPDYFEEHRGESPTYKIELHLYVIGPHRHYEWTGNTLLEAVEECESEVSTWLDEFESNQR